VEGYCECGNEPSSLKNVGKFLSGCTTGSLSSCAQLHGVPFGRAAWEACSATWNLGTNSAFALGLRKTTENLDRVGRPQDLPDAN
jgi:hypothetical protein